MIMTHLHNFSEGLKLVIEIIGNLHILALIIVNVTKTPHIAESNIGSYTSVNRWYRLIELLAGIVTPLAKK